MLNCQVSPNWLMAACLPLLSSSFLSIGGHHISRGTRVLVNMWSIHHDSAHWDKPDLFNPGKKQTHRKCQMHINICKVMYEIRLFPS